MSLRSRPVVCQVVHSLEIGGAERLACRLAQRLGARYRFVVACLDELGPLEAELSVHGVSVERLGRRPGLDPACAIRLADLWRRMRIDLVHAHQYTPYFYSSFARCFYRRPPILFTEHGRHQPDHPRPRRLLANRLLFERRDRVVGVGRAVRQALLENERFAPSRVAIIPNGIDLVPYQSVNGRGTDPGKNGVAERESTRSSIQVARDDFMIVQVARLDPVKDHVTSLRAIAQVVRSCPKVRLALVGEGSMKSAIERSVDALRLGPFVRMLGYRSDVPALLRAADLFLLSSRSEGIPLTVMEAMAAGLPVVATRVGGMEELMVHGVTGLLVPPENPPEMARCLIQLVDQPVLCDRMGRDGRRRAFADFGEDRMVAGYAGIYQAMLGRTNGRLG